MAVVIQTYAHSGELTLGQSYAPTAPSGITSGDLLVIFMAHDGENQSGDDDFNAVTGWTLQTQKESALADVNAAIYTRTADGTGTDNPTITWNTNGNKAALFLRIDGHDTIDAVGTWNENGSSNWVSNALTTSVANCLCLCFGAGDGEDTAPYIGVTGTGWSLHTSDSGSGAYSSAGGTTSGVATRTLASPGSDGAVIINPAVNDSGITVHIAISPAAAGGATRDQVDMPRGFNRGFDRGIMQFRQRASGLFTPARPLVVPVGVNLSQIGA